MARHESRHRSASQYHDGRKPESLRQPASDILHHEALPAEYLEKHQIALFSLSYYGPDNVEQAGVTVRLRAGGNNREAFLDEKVNQSFALSRDMTVRFAHHRADDAEARESRLW